MKNSLKSFAARVRSAPSKFASRRSESGANEIIVFRGLISLIFFFTAFIIFSPFLSRNETWIRLIALAYGFFVLLFILVIVRDFFRKFLLIQNISDVKTYPIYLFLNFWTGLIIPAAIFNEVLLSLIRSLSEIPHLGTTLCDIRMSFVSYYYSAHVYWYMHRGILIIAFVSLAYLLILPVVAKMFSRNRD